MVVDKIPRQKAGLVLYSVAGLCASLLLFIVKPNDCGSFCIEAAL